MTDCQTAAVTGSAANLVGANNDINATKLPWNRWRLRQSAAAAAAAAAKRTPSQSL